MNTKNLIVALAFGAAIQTANAQTGPIVIDHNDTDITAHSQADMQRAKDTLGIVYGHTSHGSQLTTGMEGLVGFANGGGLGLSLPPDFFDWNNGGTGGALDLHDGGMGGDVGYYPQWVNETRDYLDNPANAGTNVVIWSWCGQHVSKYRYGTMESEYLVPMSQLEVDYPEVTFVYMTGHVNCGGYHEDTILANNMIRDYVTANGKVLYDFADIERYDPDGTYFEFVDDGCNYYEYAGGPLLGNWAIEWQDSNVEGVDWYTCGSAHSEPLNANRKAYAAWALWTQIAEQRCPADFNGDGVVDTQDVLAFLNAWTAGDPEGDFNADGTINSLDVLAFLNAWAAGC